MKSDIIIIIIITINFVNDDVLTSDMRSALGLTSDVSK